jgi:hypothetical protein
MKLRNKIKSQLLPMLAAAPDEDTASKYLVLWLENHASLTRLEGNGWLDDDPEMYPYDQENAEELLEKSSRLNREVYAFTLRPVQTAAVVQAEGAGDKVALTEAIRAFEESLSEPEQQGRRSYIKDWIQSWLEWKKESLA